MSQDPTRSLPAHPDLEQQKKQAKELLAGFKRDDAEALDRVRRHLPDKATITLADAQFVLAREYGFESWAKLRHHIAERSARPPRDEFVRAVRSGEAVATRRVLERHPEMRAAVNQPLFSFDSPSILAAASSGNLTLIDVLLEFGADPNRRSDWWAGGFHVLHGSSGRVAEFLMERGAIPDACGAANLDRIELLRPILDADPQGVHERGGDGQTPLHFARSRGVADLLLERGADINARDVDHRGTPAQWMLAGRRGAGRYALAEYLVDRGAEADIFLAVALGLTGHVRSLLEADPSLLDLRTSQGEYGEKPPSSFHIYTWSIGGHLSPMQVAAKFEQDEVLAILRERAAPRQRFLAACVRGDAREARALLRDEPGLVAELGPEDQRVLPDAGWEGNAEVVTLMLELGFDPRTPGQDSGTVLHCAAWQGNRAAVEAVLGHPAGAMLVGVREATHGGTPLDWCLHGAENCRNPRGDYRAVARLLLDVGAQPPPNLENVPDALRGVVRKAMRG